MICDFELDTAMSKARRFYLDPPYKPGSTVLLHAQPFNAWRLDYSIEDDEDPDEELKPERVRERLDASLAMIGETGERRILWTSLYRPRAVTLPAYRKGRIFLASDAAHLSPIFGGRGLNLGFADAWNLASKLKMLLAGQAEPGLLDSYDRERRQMVRKTLSDLSQAAVFMARPSKGVTLMCNAVLDLVPHEPFVRDPHRAPKREGDSQTAHWNDDPPAGALAGNPLPNLPVAAAGGAEAYLNGLLPEGMVILAFRADGRLPAGLRERLDRLTSRRPVRSFVIADSTRGIGAGDALDRAGAVRAEMGAADGTMLLVRPDGYIAARVERFDLDGLEAALGALLGTPSWHEHKEAAHA